MSKKVTVIPPSGGLNLKKDSNDTKAKNRRRVAAYARVSTDEEEQQSSYDAQVSYYENYIKNNKDWEFVKVYADEGISGCNTKKRHGFQEMIKDALNGKIDLILTKSVSRFARNTVDSLTTIRNLKDHNVEVYFEKENIATFDGKGELLLTIMSSISQEESRSISENVLWGKRKVMQDGKYSVAYSHFLGYDKGMRINKAEAKVVKLIYQLFLKGYTFRAIAKELTNLHIKTPAKKNKWGMTVVKSILTNEKYCGDALLQKTYIKDFLSKKQITNPGDRPKYYIEDGHEAIIDKKTFNIVKDMIANKKKYAVGEFSGKVICGECGSVFGAKVWHSNDKYRRIIYRCNGKYEKREEDKNQGSGGKGARRGAYAPCSTNKKVSVGNTHSSPHFCSTPHFTEDELKTIIVDAINDKFRHKDIIIKECDKIIRQLSGLTFDVAHLKSIAEKKAKLVNDLIEENQKIAQDQNIYNEKYKELENDYLKAEDALNKEIAKQNENLGIINRIKNYKDIISKGRVIKEFDKELFNEIVDRVVVYKKEIKVRFVGEVEKK